MSVNSLEDLTGRYGVTIGQSLINAWNERNGKPTKRAKGYPNPEFYSLRYSFKPESIDNESPGVLKPKSGEGHAHTQYELERPGTKGGLHRFSAVEQPSKEWECILLWDPETRTLKLERLESTLNLTFEGQSSAPAPTSGTGSTNNNTNRNAKGKAKATATAPPPSTAPIVKKRQEEDEIDEITKALMEELDAEGEKDDDVDLEALLVGPPSRKEEEEEEAESEDDFVKQKPHPPPPPPQPQSQPQPQPQPPVQHSKPKATAKSSPKVQKAPKAPPKPKPKAKPKTSAATTASASGTTSKKEKEKEKEITIPEQVGVSIDDADEEEMTFGQPSRPVVKRNNHSEPNPLANSGLALPTLPSQTTPAVRHTQPIPSDLLQPPSSSMNHIQYESDSDPDVMQVGEALNDVDEDLFAHEMEMVLADNDGIEEDDEELEPVPIGESNPTTASGRLLSLNELVGVNGTDNSDDDDDDDDTSSDDSDD